MEIGNQCYSSLVATHLSATKQPLTTIGLIVYIGEYSSAQIAVEYTMADIGCVFSVHIAVSH